MGTQYFFANGDEQRGPHALEELRGVGLRPDSLVWHEGLAEWQRADTLPELAAALAGAGQTAGPPVAVGNPAQVASSAPAGLPAAVTPLSYQRPVTTTQTNGMAIASLVLGIVSVPAMLCNFLGVIAGILAIIFGVIARRQIKRGDGKGMGMATAGLICGSIPVGLIALLLVIGVIAFIARALR